MSIIHCNHCGTRIDTDIDPQSKYADAALALCRECRDLKSDTDFAEVQHYA